MEYLIGIDEVGRGPLAGPVLVSAVALPKTFYFPRNFGPLKDSKQLTKLKREEWFHYFINHKAIHVSVARVYPAQIDKTNISRAANRAAFLALNRLLKQKTQLKKSPIILDGGLYLKNKKESEGICGAKTVVRGDEKYPAVMAASIVAKVMRDRYMKNLAKKYPGYGLEVHKGYGTKFHREAIRKMGLSSIHRVSFLKFLS